MAHPVESLEGSEFPQLPDASDSAATAPDSVRPRAVPDIIIVDGKIRLKDVVYADDGEYLNLDDVAFAPPHDPNEPMQASAHYRTGMPASFPQETPQSPDFSEKSTRLSAARNAIADLMGE